MGPAIPSRRSDVQLSKQALINVAAIFKIKNTHHYVAAIRLMITGVKVICRLIN